MKMNWEEKLSIYDKIIKKAGFERKGKTMPYTSVNGYMFSQINKDGELGIRFSDDVQKKLITKFNSTTFTSYGKEMNGYVLIPQGMWDDIDALVKYLKESYQYVKSLKPK